ncbi:MAG: 2-succinyl-5-enolpyruvyl-6-hydroxy-3-cyclohexene-1-carboxylic-acid synthase [Bacteroidales bacterium]|nr:2-succinyl-5-enolpyruvyl-6-hydroxy-3-cyclohexene-1-carboxylic-acid synthase [Bacteroidales bacterium]
MYSNKENINILTSLLVAHGVKHAVVCPGSRNAAIIHNFSECPHIMCYPVTDERSAAFVALGIAQATGQPTVVCVTSGTALLNTAPAVAEATYQHHGIIVVSADRPTAWIGQNDGQTMPQVGALGSFVGKCVNIPEPHTDEERWHVNRSVNEALIEAKKSHRPSVHINVPLSEPLFEYTAEKLPKERKIEFYEKDLCNTEPFMEEFLKAKRPMIVIGQTDENTLYSIFESLELLNERAVIINEALGAYSEICTVDLVLKAIEDNDKKYVPDLVLHMGGDIVSKRLKKFLRKAKATWRISQNDEISDTFQNLVGILNCDLKTFCNFVDVAYRIHAPRTPYSIQSYLDLWADALTASDDFIINYSPAYSQAAAVKAFEKQFYKSDYGPHTHYANSSAIRLANLFARQHVWCNRGINGIEGSVSTAVGYALTLKEDEQVVLVTGDLSFFYDSNAFWNNNTTNNLSILLLNNGEGGIFRQVKGFSSNPFAVGLHNANAEHICKQNGVAYVAVHNMEELDNNIKRLSRENTTLVVEVFTDPEIDKQEIEKIYTTFKL